MDEPFRGSAAVAAGLVTPGQLRGPRFRRLFRDVYLPASAPIDLALRSRAAHLLVAGRGVLCGFSAAEMLGASCGPADAPAEVLVPGGGRRVLPGLRVHRGALPPDEITSVDGLMVTSALRTAYDLARRRPLREAVVAVDALARAGPFEPADLRRTGYRHLGARGSAQLPRVLALADPLSGSPMETRLRLALVTDGLPAPTPQHPVGRYRLDLAYPAVLLAVEHDGRDHLTPERARHDLDRQAFLTATGWTVLRFSAVEVLRRPQLVAARVRAHLITAGTAAPNGRW